MVINGVDVTAYVNERDRWYPLRTVLGASDPGSMRAGWTACGVAWVALIGRARRLPEPDLHVSVGGEWSFVQTLRHLVFAMDKWFTAPILGAAFDPIGLVDEAEWEASSSESAAVSVTTALAARSGQAMRFGGYLADVDAEALARTVDVIDNGPHLVRQCLATVLEEEFWHLRYAERDLTVLEAGR